MTLAILVLASAALDAITMLMLPVGSETNIIAASFPLIAVGVKLLAAFGIAALVYERRRYFRGVAMFGAAAWLVGAAANVLVLA